MGARRTKCGRGGVVPGRGGVGGGGVGGGGCGNPPHGTKIPPGGCVRGCGELRGACAGACARVRRAREGGWGGVGGCLQHPNK